MGLDWIRLGLEYKLGIHLNTVTSEIQIRNVKMYDTKKTAPVKKRIQGSILQ